MANMLFMNISQYKSEIKLLLEKELAKYDNASTASERLQKSTINKALKSLDKGVEDAFNFYSKPKAVPTIEVAHYLARY